MVTLVDLDLFYGKVRFDNLGFSIGKSENSGHDDGHMTKMAAMPIYVKNP